ncbi:MAG: 3-oxoacyl-ACP reductase family protein [Deltaproteobacteria bacterium]|jgi:3-oxoacyl-[acyl-carrier protein] reductase
MDLGLKDKIALVTGGSRGIGRAIAEGLAREGAKVCLTYTSNEAAAQETIAAIEAAGGQATAKKFDVGDAAAAKAAVDELVKAEGALHILVNNAGVSVDGLLMRYKDEDLARIFQTNVFGSFYLARAAARPMMKARWGRIIMLGSVVGETGNVGQTAYASTKAALDGMAKSLARELASRNITANVVAPGYIGTDMTADISDEMKEMMLKSIPAGAMGKPEDIADTVAFLCSDRAGYVTGQVVNVNGGMYM